MGVKRIIQISAVGLAALIIFVIVDVVAQYGGPTQFIHDMRREWALPYTNSVREAVPADVVSHSWYIADQTFSHCMAAKESPAQQLEMLRANGGNGSASERRDDTGTLLSVEVGTENGNGTSTYWTYYSSEEGCQAALAERGEAIPNDYR